MSVARLDLRLITRVMVNNDEKWTFERHKNIAIQMLSSFVVGGLDCAGCVWVKIQIHVHSIVHSEHGHWVGWPDDVSGKIITYNSFACKQLNDMIVSY